MKKGLLYAKATFVVLSLLLCLAVNAPFYVRASEEESGACLTSACSQKNSACVCGWASCDGCKIPNGETGCGNCNHKPALGD